MTIEYIDRDTWGGGDLRHGYVVPHEQFRGLVIHHTVIVMQDYDRDGYLHGDRDDVIRYMKQLQVARPDLGSEVPYSFVVFRGKDEGSCIVCEGRGWGVTGAHTAGYNSTSYGVALAGNFEIEEVTPGMLAGIRYIGGQLAFKNPLPTIGHRDTKATACPGKNMYKVISQVQPPFVPMTETVPTDTKIEDEGCKSMDMYVEVTDTFLAGQIWGVFWVHDGISDVKLYRRHIQGVEWQALQHKYEAQLIRLPWAEIAGVEEVQ